MARDIIDSVLFGGEFALNKFLVVFIVWLVKQSMV